jgi:hypothetical protein
MPIRTPESTPQPRPIYVRLGSFDFRVRPATFRYSPPYGEGGEFVLVNQTEFDAAVDFVTDDLVLGSEGPIRELPLPAGRTSAPLRVNPAIPNGTYPYKVSLALGRDVAIEATGGSRPDIDVQK